MPNTRSIKKPSHLASSTWSKHKHNPNNQAQFTIRHRSTAEGNCNRDTCHPHMCQPCCSKQKQHTLNGEPSMWKPSTVFNLHDNGEHIPTTTTMFWRNETHQTRITEIFSLTNQTCANATLTPACIAAKRSVRSCSDSDSDQTQSGTSPPRYPSP